MAARLGKVLYWTACGLAPLWTVGDLLSPQNEPDWLYHISAAVVGGLLIWGVGRAILYILAGK